jgi:raffinose/stachyose/melibiose transport system permease protein
MIGGMYYSFTDWSGIFGTQIFNGLDNYKKIFQDAAFFNSLKITAIFVFWNCLLTNILAMLFAIVLSDNSKRNNISKMILFTPNVISLVVTGFIWQFLLSRVFNQIYDQSGISLFGISFLGSPDIVIYSCVLVSLWAGIGYIMVIYIAALQGVDQSHVEAAIIDGCGTWRLFWQVKLPEILPTVSVGLFINISGSIKVYDLIYALTQGGPGGSSELVMLNIYNEAFERQNAGYANTKAMIVTAIIILITLLQLKLTKKRK